MKACRAILILPCLALIALTGCGAGSSSERATNALSSASRAHRLLQPGDSWTYTLTGSARTANGIPEAASGTLTITVASATLMGAPVLTETYSYVLNLADGKIEVDNPVYYVQQDATTHDIDELADEPDGGSTQRLLKSAVMLIPGAWSTGLRASAAITFSAGGTGTRSLAVTGQASVQTPAGTFAAWQATETETYWDGSSSQASFWYAPDLGAPAKLSITRSDAQGSVLTLTGSLRATTAQ